MSPLEQVYQQYRQQGLAVVGIESWSRRGPMRLQLYRQQYGITFPLLHGGPPDGYVAFGSPAVYVIDRRGRVVAYRSGGDCDWVSPAFGSLLQVLLAEPAAASSGGQ
ncbi:MAG: hypothetical protein Q8R35_03110 [bacterium]|nr:hypothetical protein [bacterium]